MERFKLCPHCGTQNDPKNLYCDDCGADLTTVPVSEPGSESAGSAPETPEDARQPVRVCPACGARNPSNARKCLNCGEDISDIAPEDEDAQKAAISFILESLDGAYAYEITDGEVTVGREHAMREYLRTRIFVSRRQAQFTVMDGKLFIENLSFTNYTYVNNRLITERTELRDGDELGLGGICIDGDRQSDAAYFRVRIGSCT